MGRKAEIVIKLVSLPLHLSQKRFQATQLRPAMLLPAPGLVSSLATYAAEHWTCFGSFSFSSWSCLGFWPGRRREWSKGGRKLLPLQPVCQPVSGSESHGKSQGEQLLLRFLPISVPLESYYYSCLSER